MTGRIAVIGLGNILMRDDSIGILVTRELRRRPLGSYVTIYESQEMGIMLLDYMRDASKVVVVDALKTGKLPGTVSKYFLEGEQDPPTELPSLHALQLHDMLGLARATGFLKCPVSIVGVEPKDISLGEGLSPEVASALQAAVMAVLAELQDSAVTGSHRRAHSSRFRSRH